MHAVEAGSLDIERSEALLAWLRRTGRIEPGEEPAITVLAGGVSNRTVLIERPGGEAWVLKQALGKLRVAVDWFSPPERVHREALGLRWLAELAPAGSTTPLLFEDFEEHLIGMTAVPTPHANWKAMLLTGDLHPDHVEQFARLLGTVHRRAWERRDEVEPVFRDRGYFESLRLEPYWAYTAERVPVARAFLLRLIDDVRARPLTLVHGDYSPKNVLVHDGRLVLLDHEVIHWGDPAFDLGFGHTHLLAKALHVAGRRQEFADASRRLWRVYRETVGDTPWAGDLEAWAVRATLGCLLARVDGRSPLEYLSEAERGVQRRAALALMAEPPPSYEALANRWLEGIGGSGWEGVLPPISAAEGPSNDGV
jgi:aminoglycoside phosphotransferase (APT) family kinase protein